MQETLTSSALLGADTAVLSLLLTYALGAWVVWRHHVPWEMRGFERFTGQWWHIYAGSVLVGLLAASIAALKTGNFALFLIFGVVGFVFTFTAWTDLYTNLAPMEIQHLGLYVMFPVAAFGVLSGDLGIGGSQLAPERQVFLLPYEHLTQLGLYALIMPVMLTILAIIANGGVGLGDLRALWVVTFAFGWWYGIEWLLCFSIVSMLVQILAGFPAKHFGWGKMRRAPFPGPRRVVNRIYRRVTKSDRQLWPDMGRAIPWLPAISATFIVAPLLFL